MRLTHWPSLKSAILPLLALLLLEGVCLSEQQNSGLPSVRKTCSENLNLIFDALQQYSQDNGSYPSSLGKLIPTYISDPDVLVCPHAKSAANHGMGKAGFFDISESGSNYSLEIVERNVPGQVYTYREFKELQVARLGNIVPLVRCFLHGK